MTSSFLYSMNKMYTSRGGNNKKISNTVCAGDPGLNPEVGKQWSRDHPINVPAKLTLCDANLCYQELEALDWRKWT